MAGDWTRRRSQTALSVLDPGQGRPHAVEAQPALPGLGTCVQRKQCPW